MQVDKYIKIIYIFCIIFITAYISKIFTNLGMSAWYFASYKPDITPADSIFPIVWTILYFMLGLSLLFAIRESSFSEVHKYNNEFIFQLFLQILWCYTFFYQGQLMLGFLILVVMDIATFRMIHIFNDSNRWAAYLLYPYLAWILFATIINLNFVTELGLSVNN